MCAPVWCPECGACVHLFCSVGYELVEASPHDTFWGRGHDNSGHNHLGRLLMKVSLDPGPVPGPGPDPGPYPQQES